MGIFIKSNSISVGNVFNNFLAAEFSMKLEETACFGLSVYYLICKIKGYAAIKGSLTRDFELQVLFHESAPPPPPHRPLSIPLRPILIFSVHE
jgi:hypothetical protein